MENTSCQVALDAGTDTKDDYVSASGSGGFGHAKENPITVDGPVSDIHIELRAAPMMMQPNKPNGPKGIPYSFTPMPPKAN